MRTDGQVRGRARLIQLVVTASIGGSFVVGGAVQTTLLQSAYGHATAHSPLSLATRATINVVVLTLAVLVVAQLRLLVTRMPRVVVTAVAIGVFFGACWVFAVLVLRVQLGLSLRETVEEGIAASIMLAVSIAVGAACGQLVERLHREESRAIAASARAAIAFEALQTEELRVRRELADGLHGGVQQLLVLAEARLSELGRGVEAGISPEATRGELSEIRGQLERLRSVDLRELGRVLYPEGLELGLPQALRIMLSRLPASIGVDVRIDPAFTETQAAPRVEVNKRLVLLRVAEEAISNALRHGQATHLWVELAAGEGRVLLSVSDNGSGIPGDAKLRGLQQLARRLESVRGTLEIRQRVAGPGTVLEAGVPLTATDSRCAAPGAQLG